MLTDFKVVGWILLALTVALVNAGSGLTALWVLLTAVGFTIFLLFPVKWAFRWLARRTGSLENGQPTTLMMTVTIVLVFISAFFTDIIGVHAIFGKFPMRSLCSNELCIYVFHVSRWVLGWSYHPS